MAMFATPVIRRALTAALGTWARTKTAREMSGHTRLAHLLDTWHHAAERGYLFAGDEPLTLTTAERMHLANICYAIAWACQTGRLAGRVEHWLEHQSVRTLVTLIGEIADACPTIGDVPHYLNTTVAAHIERSA